MKRRNEIDEIIERTSHHAKTMRTFYGGSNDIKARHVDGKKLKSQACDRNGNSGRGEDVEEVDSFDKMGFRDELLKGFYGYGFQSPSAIQRRAIKPILEGRDVIAQAQSGTGKTATIAMISLQKSDVLIRFPQVLVLSPSRELAQQIHRTVLALGDYSRVQCLAAVGGNSVQEDNTRFERGVHIVSGTPGRVLDLIRRRVLTTRHLSLFILDEADEMLAKGFKEQIDEVVASFSSNSALASHLQTALFSATMSPETVRLTQRYMSPNALHLLVRKEELTVKGIRQFYVHLEEDRYKLETLVDIYSRICVAQSVIFANTRVRVVALAAHLKKSGFASVSIHSALTQPEREAAMKAFRSGQARILITTDVGARGVDVQQVQLVVNYDLPTVKENYLHRIGRSGRFGRSGVAINFITEDDTQTLKDLERFYAIKVLEMPASINFA